MMMVLGYNNTVYQNELGVPPPDDPPLTYEFAACYSRGSGVLGMLILIGMLFHQP